MRSKLLVLLVAAGAFLAVLGAGIAPVGALSCAPHPDGSPAAIASGTENLSTEDEFFDRYDYAVIGTVTEMRTVGVGEPDYGATTVSIDVVAVLGGGTADPTIDISSPDPGWLTGYPYETGNAYFIPVQAEGPAGQPNFSFLCDPIAEVDVGIATELRQLASDAGIPFSTPDGDTSPAPARVDETDDAAIAAPDTGSLSGMTVPATLALAGTAAVLVWAIARWRRVRPAAASS